MLRESVLKNQQSILEQDSNSLSIIKKEITKQSEIDVGVQLSISQKIEVLKQNATALAKKLQNQMHKNVDLEAIIVHLKTSLEKEKVQEASFRDINNSESLIGLENRYKKQEYDLVQLNGKANRMAENVERKWSKINQNRTQRVIDSGIFRNIEKQIVQSELTFKKLLIEKIKYQNQYEKLLKDYESLKKHAENHCQKRSNRFINECSDILLYSASDVVAAANKKFTDLNMLEEGVDLKPKPMTYIEEQQQFLEQKNIIIIKKLLSQTGLESSGELIYHFSRIDAIKEKCYNQMMAYVDQINEIQKYLNQFRNSKEQNKLHYYEEAKRPTKIETFKVAEHKYLTSINEITQLEKAEMEQIHNFFKDTKFKQILKSLQISQSTQMDQGYNLEDFKLVIQNLQDKISAILSKEVINRNVKCKTSHSKQHQKLQELMSKVRRPNESLSIMEKQDFRAECHIILKATVSKANTAQPTQKRPSYIRVKK